jgi:hypothetical protein
LTPSTVPSAATSGPPGSDWPTDRADRSQAGFEPISGGPAQDQCKLPETRGTLCHIGNSRRGALESEHGQIRTGIPARDFCRDLGPVCEDYFNILLTLDNMVRCEDQIRGICNSAGRHAAACIHKDGGFASLFRGICQRVRKFYQYILAHRITPLYWPSV